MTTPTPEDKYTAEALAILDFLYGNKIDAWDADTRAEIIEKIVNIIRRVVSQEATIRLQCANDSQMHLDRALAAEADNAALRRFAGECLEPWPECLCDLEGDMQSRLARAGLIEERIADHHGDDYEIGDSVFFLTDLGKAAIDAAILAGKP